MYINVSFLYIIFYGSKNFFLRNVVTCRIISYVYYRQIGAEAMHCDCLDGYVGYNCETRLLDTSDTGNILSRLDTFNPFYFGTQMMHTYRER